MLLICLPLETNATLCYLRLTWGCGGGIGRRGGLKILWQQCRVSSILTRSMGVLFLLAAPCMFAKKRSNSGHLQQKQVSLLSASAAIPVVEDEDRAA